MRFVGDSAQSIIDEIGHQMEFYDTESEIYHICQNVVDLSRALSFPYSTFANMMIFMNGPMGLRRCEIDPPLVRFPSFVKLRD